MNEPRRTQPFTDADEDAARAARDVPAPPDQHPDLPPDAPTGEMLAAPDVGAPGTQPFVDEAREPTGTMESLGPSQPTDGIAAVDVVAGFHLRRKLGEGGMATVFEAVHVTTGERVALKRVKPAGRGDKQFSDRFLREVQAAARLDHPHVCKVLGGGQDGDELYMAVELLEGGDLDKLLRRMGGKLPAAATTVIVCELLEALAHAHDKGVVHRDIKPANVMLSADGAVKLVDFGIARAVGDQKLTATGSVVGTPSYMSPEQARGLDADGRSDLFSVGVMILELLTGENPFFAETATATVMKILLEPAPPLFALDPSAPGILHHVVGGLLERDRERRYPSAAAALADLAPYRELVEKQHPRLLRDCIERPDEMRAVLLAEQARFERDRAADLLELGDAGLPGATLALVRALKLEPANADARRMLDDVVRRASFDLAPNDPRLKALDVELAKPNAAAATWRRAADLQRAAGNPPGQARALSYYLQRQPTDELAARQFRAIASGPEVAAKAPGTAGKPTRVALSTREIVDGIRTGGFKAVASTELFTSVRAAPPTVDDPFATATAPAGATRLPEARPAARPARAAAARAGGGEPNVVLVGGARDEGSGRGGALMIGGALVALVALGLTVVVSSTREGAKEVEKTVQAAQTAVSVEDRTREGTQRLLDRAREALAQNAGTDAIGLAQQAMSFQPSLNEKADAYFIMARARVNDGDDMAARGDLRRYFATAPPGHRDIHDAKTLAATIDARVGGAP